MSRCESCSAVAVVHARWITSMGPQHADLCAQHAQYVQDRCLAREAADARYCAGLTFEPISEAG